MESDPAPENDPQNDVEMEEVRKVVESTDEITKTSDVLHEKNSAEEVLEIETQTKGISSDKFENRSEHSMETDIERIDPVPHDPVVEVTKVVGKQRNEKFNSKSCVALPEIIDVEGKPSAKSGKVIEDIIICDDDNTSKRCCCNLECSRVRTQFQNAPPFVLTYYGYKYKKRKTQKVCTPCFEKAVEHQEHLAYLLMEQKPLLTAEFPEKFDIEVISDESDEEDSLKDLPLGKDFLLEFDEDLTGMINESIEKYKLDFQIKETDSILSTKFNDLDEEFLKLDATIDSLQKQVDDIRAAVYKGCSPKIKELPAEEIIDVPGSPSERRFKIFSPSITSSYVSPTKRPYSNPSLQESPRRPSLAGVATKKVTQVQRSAFPGLPQIEVMPVQQQQQQEIVALEPIRLVRPTLPPVGALVRPRPAVHDVLYVMRHGYYGVWARGKILEVLPKMEVTGFSKSEFVYKVRFESRKSSTVKTVTGKQLAYSTPSPVRLPVGTRVIALFRDEWAKECYYAGIVAEPPKAVNKFRYLIFFDDGYAQYVVHEKVLLVCESSSKVWEDIHPESRDFVRGYLEQYPERPMLKLQQGQIVKTEWNGKWWIARVLEVDGSLVKMHFDADGRTELIYRGSTRLGPLYSELHNADRKKLGSFGRHRSMGISSLKKRNMPYVEYTRTDIEDNRHEDSGGVYDEYRNSERSLPARAVAKKSTSKRSDTGRDHLEALLFQSQRELSSGHVESIFINPTHTPRRFVPHQCGHRCIDGIKYDSTQIRRYNPLVLPQLHGWQRHITRCKGKKIVVYRTPCGRRVRNMEELHRYLRVSKSVLSVDLFDYDSWVHCFAEFVMPSGFINIKDLSYGCENVPVPCVNDRDHTEPEYVKYSTVRLPMEGVNVNTNPEFLVSCDCSDDCQDKDKCACWQLTIQGTAYGPGGKVDKSVGYNFKRLREPVMTGIYECNSRCKCASTCFNRVAQHPLQLRLQVFKTENRGWGIRCLNDVPHGAFICIYAGRLLTEQGANEGGKNYGDEYLAELDYIEVVERLKEGYESDVVEDDNDSSDFENPKDVKKDRKVRALSDSGSEEEEDGETSQDAHDSDFELDIKHQHLNVVPLEESTIRTRLRNRKSRNSSTDSQSETKKEVKKNNEPMSLDRELKKMEIEKKGSTDDSSSYITLSDDDDEDQREREPSRFAVMSGSGPKKEAERRITYKSVREYYGDDEYCYIMDAKNDGNIGRYLNHSCTPNVFVQNVFVDTHDLRFPWVAFFALTYISAGTELTWDYNYDVGSVPGKVLHCYCGSNECRGRLL